MIGAHVWSHSEIASHEYHAGLVWNWCGLCEQCEEQLGPPCRSVQQVYRSLRAFTMRCGP